MEASLVAAALSSTISCMLSPRNSQHLMQAGASEAQLDTMKENFLSIQKFLDNVCICNIEFGNNTTLVKLNRWLQKVNDLTFYVENSIDKYESEILRRKNRSFKKTSWFSLAFRMSRKISKILSLLDELQKEASTMGESTTLTRSDTIVTVAAPNCNLNNSYPTSELFLGRNIDQQKITQTLVSPNNNTTEGDIDIFTIAIVGIAGIGKTTLAKKVYRNEIIQNHFGKKFWVKVGEVFDETRILKDMLLQALPEEMLNSSEYETITSKLLDFMNGEKTLIVLDNVCCVNQEQLRLLHALHNGGCNISILVTTRREETASSISASYTHHLQQLSEGESWDLFQNVGTGAGSTEDVDELEKVGRMVIDYCNGIPGVIWKVAGSIQDRELILSTLSSSFSSLPKALRQCFAYCSIFPKYATIGKSDLIRLWLAQGFLYEEAGENSSTETAEKFFDILLKKSLLQASKLDEDGNVIDCTMHHLAHELAIKFSKHDVRHLVISSENTKEALKSRSNRQLRTIYSMVAAVPENLLSQARSLYVLILDGIRLKEVPKNLGKLKFLRYLDLSNNPITYLPESITHLYLLQTLLLANCNDLMNLPMEGLKILNDLSVIKLPPHLEIQMLSPTLFRIQPPNEQDEECGGSTEMAKLGNLPDIAGSLCISGLEYLKSKEASLEARIGMKNRISALELCWNMSEKLLEDTDDNGDHDENVLDGLQPHSKIEKLKFVNYGGQQFPMWVMMMKGEDNKKFHKIEKIELVDCKRCLKLPTMGHLPGLRELILSGMDKIESIGPELYKYDDDDAHESNKNEVFFRVLTRLELRNCSRLKEWLPAPESENNRDICQAFPSLETLQLVNCPNLNSIPTSFQRLRSLVIQGIPRSSWMETIIIKSCRNDSTLTSLALHTVSELTRLPNELFQCSSLEKLSIQKCEHFNSWPRNSWKLISLKELCIDDCSRLSYPPAIVGLTALNTLVISRCGRLTVVPQNLEMCRSLSKLAITRCISLNHIPDLQQMTSLEELDILDCVKVRSLPEGLHSLPKLRTMRVGGVCISFDRFPECKSLEKLWLKGNQDMNSLPQRLNIPQQLKVLRIWSFASLTHVPEWICNLKDLEILIFQECERLKELPLREKMMQLKKLSCLRIEKCPILEERFEKGLERKKIEHVPHIKINNSWLQGDRSSLFQELAEQRVDRTDTNLEDEDNDEYVDAYEDEMDTPAAEDGSQRKISLVFYSLAFCLLITVVNSFRFYWTIWRLR